MMVVRVGTSAAALVNSDGRVQTGQLIIILTFSGLGVLSLVAMYCGCVAGKRTNWWAFYLDAPLVERATNAAAAAAAAGMRFGADIVHAASTEAVCAAEQQSTRQSRAATISGGGARTRARTNTFTLLRPSNQMAAMFGRRKKKGSGSGGEDGRINEEEEEGEGYGGGGGYGGSDSSRREDEELAAMSPARGRVELRRNTPGSSGGGRARAMTQIDDPMRPQMNWAGRDHAQSVTHTPRQHSGAL